MQKIRRLFLAVAIFALLLFSVSCESESKVMNGGEVTISGPSFIEVTSGEKTISATPSDVKYKYTMNPTWTITADNPAYGATGDTARELTSFDNLGYFTQGIWNFTLIAYIVGVDNSEQILYEYSTNVEVNSSEVNIKINPKDIQYAAGNDADCNLTLSNYKVYIPDASSKYGVGVDSDYVVYYEVKPLESGKTGIGKTEVKAGSFTFDENSDYGTITNLSIGKVKLGVYELIITIEEKKDGVFVKTGGTAASLSAFPGATLTFSGELKLSDYVETGSGAIKADDGSVSNSIALTVKKGSEILSEKNGATETVGKAGATDTLTVYVKDSQESTNYLWLINGSPVTEGIDNSNKSLSVSASSYKGKTICITYMILDNSNLSKQSENVYVKIT